MSPSVQSGPSSMSATGSTSPPSGGACYDPIDVDSFLNYDQLRSFSPSQSPLSAPTIPPAATANPNNTLLRRPDPTTSSAQKPSFAAPSHRYDLHKQQTGIPWGAVAHTSAVLESSSFNNSYRDQSLFDLPVDDLLFDPQAADDLMNLALTPAASNQASFGAPSEMDLELNPASPDHPPAFFSSARSTTSTSEFVDPSVLGKSEPSRPPPSHPGAMPRLWPGVHQQQAAMAKARQQQQQQQQQQQLEEDKEDRRRQSRPVASTPALRHLSASTAFSEDDAASRRLDSIAEEKIPQLLSSMRQASVAGSDGAGTPQPEQMRDHVGRSRKDEDDMDEDERLLASEEGKKLSSKERRQLRNKVSARAFRSRRKEYIGQLEGEAATRNKEVNDLKQENRALREENTRLSDLTRMLLSSPAFSTFLNQLDASGSSSAAAAAASVKPEAAPAATMSDAPAPVDDERSVESRSRQPSHETTHVGMTLMPDAPLDMSILDPAGNDPWAFGALANPIWGNNRPQVFSVHDVPDGPAVDRIESTALLSEKPLDPAGALASFDHAKGELAPLPPTMPTAMDEVSTATSNEAPAVHESCSEDFDESDPAFALFADSDVAERVATPSHLAGVADPGQVAGPRIGSEKEQSEPILTVSATTDAGENSTTAAAMERFHRLCTAAEAPFQRISRVTSRL